MYTKRFFFSLDTHSYITQPYACYKYDGLCIEPLLQKVSYGEKDNPLTRHEYQTLLYLADHPGWIFSQEDLYQAVWKEEPINIKCAVYCTISNFRKKLRRLTREKYIQTFPGMGYRFIRPSEV